MASIFNAVSGNDSSKTPWSLARSQQGTAMLLVIVACAAGATQAREARAVEVLADHPPTPMSPMAQAPSTDPQPKPPLPAASSVAPRPAGAASGVAPSAPPAPTTTTEGAPTPPPPPPPPPSSPPSVPPASATPAPSSGNTPQRPQRIEIEGRTNDTNERRESTAAKIVIGRDEIERYGDSSTTEVLKRLPGVTVGGAPGRGGAPRMRGLGAGFTAILLNGERLPPGFSIDSITPEQIDRIEVLRAPTAETGARAIAGTINIITREGFKKRLNDLKVGFQLERGAFSPGLFYTRNDSLGEDIIYTGSLALFSRRTLSPSTRETSLDNEATGANLERYVDDTRSQNKGGGFNANGRVQYRIAQGHSLVLMPMAIQNRSNTESTVTRTPPGASRQDPEYASGRFEQDGVFRMLRLNTQYNGVFAEGLRADVRLNGGVHAWKSDSVSRTFDATPSLLRNIDFHTDFTDKNVTFSSKLTKLFVENHNVVGGVEAESNQRDETRTRVERLANGTVVPPFADFGDNLTASVRRGAAFVQDEWNITPQWAAHAGLRWEGIRTQGSGDGGATVFNRSSVTTPLLHAVYKFDEKRRDQVRMSLTRSYRTPTLPQLIARPSVATLNTPTTPDRYGNPALKPELATGIDLAFERYLDDGGVLSANLFHRRIKDLIRNRIDQNAVTGRYESRPLNISDARTSGLELEAKFRLDQAIADAPRVDLRLNASLFDSKVDGIAGPNNRLEQQPRGTMNMGADYRFRGTPVSLGGNLNYTPGGVVRIAENQVFRESAKVVGDAYATWTFNPNLVARLSASNLAPRTYESANTVSFQVGVDPLAQTTTTRDRTAINWSFRLEMKL